MEKTKEIHNKLKRRKFINSEINYLNEKIYIINKKLNNFKTEKNILDFELNSWDMFYTKILNND